MNLLAETSFWAEPIWDGVISLCLLGFMVVSILAVFGHGGKIELSPQRQAAIATGHTDRKTVFENPIFGPVLWILLSMAHRLNFPRVKTFIHRKLVAAGNPDYFTPEEYLALSFLLGLSVGLLLEVLHLVLTGQISLLAIGLGLIIGVSLSILQINERASKRMQNIVRQLPYALDLISLAMGAGATFTEAVETIVRDSDDDPKSPHFALNTELRAMLAEIELGAPRREALQSMARRVPLESMKGLVALGHPGRRPRNPAGKSAP